MKTALFACIIFDPDGHGGPFRICAGRRGRRQDPPNERENRSADRENKGSTGKADSEMALAKMRLAEQLRKSQEDLSRQLEILEQFVSNWPMRKRDGSGAV